MLPLVFLLSAAFVNAKFYKTNITDFSKCKVYYSRSGSNYRDFFELSESPTNGSLLDFHFSVMSQSDAHILLAPSSDVQKGDPAYEIVIGAGGNTFCDIRRMQKSGVKATVRIKGLLSGLDLQSFWIHMSRDGVIDVGKQGEELPFLTWTDPDPLPLKVFSFSTWPGVEAKWYFDCVRDGNGPHSKKIARPMLPLEKLRHDLLFAYDPYARPVYNFSTITAVKFRLTTTFVALDEHASVLQYKGIVTLSWHDEKLKWNQSEYGGIDSMHIFRREIWIPDLFLFNAVGDGSDILEDTMLAANSSGHITWTTNIKMDSWCSTNDLGRWPRDQHTCSVLLGFMKHFESLQLLFDAQRSSFSCPYSSTWAILEVESFANKGWQKNSSVTTFDPPGLELHLKMRRTSVSYTLILFAPFFVIASCLLLTFWVSPFGYLKFSLACLQLLLASAVLVTLGLIVPIHSRLVPNLVLLYSYTLVATVACIIIETVVINLTRLEHKNPLPNVLTRLLTSHVLKMFLCLPDVKSSNRYGNLNVSLPKLLENHQATWILLGTIIDRMSFFVFLGVAVYAFCLTY